MDFRDISFVNKKAINAYREEEQLNVLFLFFVQYVILCRMRLYDKIQISLCTYWKCNCIWTIILHRNFHIAGISIFGFSAGNSLTKKSRLYSRLFKTAQDREERILSGTADKNCAKQIVFVRPIIYNGGT